jgi:hypothetical protein
VVAHLCDGRTLQIAAGGSGTRQVIRVQVDRDAGARAQPGFEREPSLHGSAARRDGRQARVDTGIGNVSEGPSG